MKLSLAVVASATLLLAAIGSVGCSTTSDSETGMAEGNIGEAEAPLARFAPYLKTLKSTLESGRSTEEIANTLLGSGRPAAFSLQALCRIYGDQDPKFGQIRDDFKGLEDGIGQYDKWSGIYEAAVSAGKDAATLERLKTQRDQALTQFTKMLTDRKWLAAEGTPTRIHEIEEFLANGFDWKTRKEDRTLVLDTLIDELEDIKKTTYDMTILEHGDGVHELRRDMRWVLIEQLALNGMISLKDSAEACPIPAYAGLPDDGRYAALRTSAAEPSPCKVSKCVVLAAAKAVSDLGTVKDQAENEVNINGAADVVPERLQPEAKALYEEIVKNDLLGVYKGELDACKAAL